MDDTGAGRGARHDPRRLGAHGERLVEQWYRDRGYRVLARNWRCRDGELDLIVAHGSDVVVCEVKTRSSDRYGSGFAAVTSSKARRLRRLTARWLREAAPFRPGSVRIDVAAVVGRRVEVREGVV